MAAIYLIRHGRTQWNKDEVFRGRADIPLDPWGRRQAAAVGEALKDKGIEVILTSPLERAVETATIAGKGWGDIPLLPEPGLIDIDYGQWQGLSRREVEEGYPHLYQKWAKAPQEVLFPGGESLEDVACRSWEVVTKVVTCLPGLFGSPL